MAGEKERQSAETVSGILFVNFQAVYRISVCGYGIADCMLAGAVQKHIGESVCGERLKHEKTGRTQRKCSFGFFQAVVYCGIREKVRAISQAGA